MGGVDVGGSDKKRATNSDINMIPFIDLLMVTIAFLLITAVWVTNARLKTNAEVPGQAGCGEECSKEPLKTGTGAAASARPRSGGASSTARWRTSSRLLGGAGRQRELCPQSLPKPERSPRNSTRMPARQGTCSRLR